MSAALAKGEDISKSWLYEQNRLEVITSWIEGQINQFGALAQMQTSQLQSLGVSLGQSAAQALLQATVPPTISFSFGMPAPGAIQSIVGATQRGSPLYDLFQGFGAEAAQGAKTALISGVTLGYNPRQIAPLVQSALDISRNRALTISRTEMLRAYRDANLESFRANSDVVEKWRWTCELSARTCIACLEMDGEEFPLDESMDSHVCCRCVMVPITASWDSILSPLGIDTSGMDDTSFTDGMQRGEEWFNSQDASVQQDILGKGKYEAWSNGDFQLSDIVGHKSDPVWGDSIYERSLKDTLAAASKAPAAVQEVPKLSELEQRIKALEDSMNAKYPDTVFDLAGGHPDVMEPAMKQLDALMQQYPDVAKTIPYVGTGGNAPKGYEIGNLSQETRDHALAWVQGRRFGSLSGDAYTPMTLNPKYFSDPVFTQKVLENMASSGWLAMSNPDIGYIVTHEFGHAVDFFLQQNGSDQSFMGFLSKFGDEGNVRGALNDFMRLNAKLGKNVSQYAQTSREELFAEAFASSQTSSSQIKFTKRLSALLDQLIPNGSSDGWSMVERGWTDEQRESWYTFWNKYIAANKTQYLPGY